MLEFTQNEMYYLKEMLEEKIEECKEDNTQASLNDLEIFESILSKLESIK